MGISLHNCIVVSQLQECTKLTSDNGKLVSEVKKLSAEKEKDTADRSRLESENASVAEEKKRLVATLQTAKQRLVALRTDKEGLESSCAELKRQLEAAAAEKESAQPPTDEPSTGLQEFYNVKFSTACFWGQCKTGLMSWGVCNPAYSCACPKPGLIGSVAAGGASGIKMGKGLMEVGR